MSPKKKAKAGPKADPTKRKEAPVSKKAGRRQQREEALQAMNTLAAASHVEPVRRCDVARVPNLHADLASVLVDAEQKGQLEAAWQQWLENGGCGSSSTAQPAADTPENASPSEGGRGLGHVAMHEEVVVRDGKYRLCSKAFMLTYNSLTITAQNWEAFLKFLAKLCTTLGCTEWSATLDLTFF